jgi:hypothetical protein
VPMDPFLSREHVAMTTVSIMQVMFVYTNGVRKTPQKHGPRKEAPSKEKQLMMYKDGV